MPEQFDAAGQFVMPEELFTDVRISADFQQQIEWLQNGIELSFNELILHSFDRQQEQFIESFDKKVVPVLIKLYQEIEALKKTN